MEENNIPCSNATKLQQLDCKLCRANTFQEVLRAVLISKGITYSICILQLQSVYFCSFEKFKNKKSAIFLLM